MLVRFYIAPQTGDGLTVETGFRSIINNYVNVAAGEWFDEIDNPARRISIVCVHAPQATHDTIAADSTIIAIGNPIEEANIKNALDAPISAIPNVATLKTKLEGIGISTSWYSADNTVRDGIRYLMRVFSFAQIVDGLGNANIKTFIANNLDTTMNQIPANIRNAVSNWMQSKGLATGWITSSTTVRQVLHFIVTNLGFGALKVSSEDF